MRLFFVGGWAGMHPREKRRCASNLESLERKKENQADVRLSNLASRVRKARLGGSSVQLHLRNTVNIFCPIVLFPGRSFTLPSHSVTQYGEDGQHSDEKRTDIGRATLSDQIKKVT